MHENGLFKMWFWGSDSNLSTDPGQTRGFGYATSVDGVHWDVMPVPIRAKTGAGVGYHLIEVVKLNSQYIAYFHELIGNQFLKIWRAVSDDGINFYDDTEISLGGSYFMYAATVVNGKIVAVARPMVGDTTQNLVAISDNTIDFTVEHIFTRPADPLITGNTIRDFFAEGAEIKIYGDLSVPDSSHPFGKGIDTYFSTADSSLLVTSPGIEVAVDIKPSACPNRINLSSKGLVTVAIAGAVDFDIADIDVASVRLEGLAPLRMSVADVATPYVADGELDDALDCTAAEGDGIADLVLRFDTRDLVTAVEAAFTPPPLADGDVLVLGLAGELIDGSAISGEDVVILRKKKEKKK